MKIYWDGKSKNIIGAKIKQLRINKNLTQKALAEKLQLEGYEFSDFLFIATIITTSIFLFLFAACFFIEIGSSFHSMVLGMCGVFASLGSAFFIAWIVRFHDLKKKQNQELKALKLITPYLTTIFCTINKFFPRLKSFANIHPDDTIDYPTGVIYA